MFAKLSSASPSCVAKLLHRLVGVAIYLVLAVLLFACVQETNDQNDNGPDAMMPDNTNQPPTQPTNPDPNPTQPTNPDPNPTQPTNPDPNPTQPFDNIVSTRYSIQVGNLPNTLIRELVPAPMPNSDQISWSLSSDIPAALTLFKLTASSGPKTQLRLTSSLTESDIGIYRLTITATDTPGGQKVAENIVTIDVFGNVMIFDSQRGAFGPQFFPDIGPDADVRVYETGKTATSNQFEAIHLSPKGQFSHWRLRIKSEADLISMREKQATQILTLKTEGLDPPQTRSFNFTIQQPERYAIIKSDDWAWTSVFVSDSLYGGKTGYAGFNYELIKRSMPAVLGVMGYAINTSKELFQMTSRLGFEIADHGAEHSKYTGRTDSWIRERLTQMSELVPDLICNNLPMEDIDQCLHSAFLPPNNAIGSNLFPLLNEFGYKTIFVLGSSNAQRARNNNLMPIVIGCPGTSERLTGGAYRFNFIYRTYRNAAPELCVAQVHPFSWNRTSLDQFAEMLDYFAENGTGVVTAKTYMEILEQSGAEPPIEQQLMLNELYNIRYESFEHSHSHEDGTVHSHGDIDYHFASDGTEINIPHIH